MLFCSRITCLSVMGKCKDLTATEKQDIVKSRRDGMSTLQISKKIIRDYRTIKKALENILHKRVRRKGKGFKHITERNIRQLMRIQSNYPLLTSAAVFDKACLTNIKRDKRCRILRTLGNVRKSSRRTTSHSIT